MEPLFEILRGPYAYLLIAQIVIVAMLCLTMVWLIFQRLRETANEPQPVATDAAAASAVTAEAANAAKTPKPVAGAAASTPAPSKTPAAAPSSDATTTSPPSEPAGPTPTAEALAESQEPALPGPLTSESGPTLSGLPPVSLAANADELASAANSAPPPDPGAAADPTEEAAALRDKVRYLESKLLEYEIVQEEISTLGTLKNQNEELKQQIAQLEEKLRPRTAAPAPTSVPAASPPSGGPGEPAGPTALTLPPENAPR